MKHEEAEYARELHLDLTRRLGNTAPPTVVTIEGAGMHWKCIASRGLRRCTIGCFRLGDCPEYWISFEHMPVASPSSRVDCFSTSAPVPVAVGRTLSSRDVLDSVEDWLSGIELAAFYDAHPYVDARMRALTDLRDEMLAKVPSLAAMVQNPGGDLWELVFEGKDRSCRLSFTDKYAPPTQNELLDAAFDWDKCELFRFPVNDLQRLAAVLNRWLCEGAMPSAMRKEFPWLEIGKLADYYEQGNPVEGEFLASWDDIECFYDDNDWDWNNKTRVLELIAQVRERGYDKSLRAGQSLSSLIVSRSRRHGLRDDQPFVRFVFGGSGNMEIYTSRDGKTRKRSEIAFTAEIDALLRDLAAQEIS